MKQDHITDILDNAPLASLSETELQTIRAHVSSCAECKRAFAAAQISFLLMKARTSEAAANTLHANPFFQTRVLAAWREQQSAGAWSLRRLWNTTGAIVASMAATTAALAVLTFVAPSSNVTDQQTAALVPYSAESVVLEDQNDNQLTNDQVIDAVYADDVEGK